jgi:hypothetical protein
VSDDEGLIEMLSEKIDYFRAKPVNISKITILLDHGYHPEKLSLTLKSVYPNIVRKTRFELSTKPSKQEKAAAGKFGFVCACDCPVGGRTFQCLDGTLQDSGKEL